MNFRGRAKLSVSLFSNKFNSYRLLLLTFETAKGVSSAAEQPKCPSTVCAGGASGWISIRELVVQ